MAEMAKSADKLIPTSIGHGIVFYIINGNTTGPEHVLYIQITNEETEVIINRGNGLISPANGDPATRALQPSVDLLSRRNVGNN
jgi:hypothetical protein